MALLAVMLLFVAPVISKGRDDRMPLQQTCEMATNHHSATHAAHDHAAMMQAEEFACGYCELLIHAPFIVGIFIPTVWLMVLLTRPHPLYYSSALPQLDATYLPRAPPRFHLSPTA
ncbi:MAG: DUF2946 family protein [Candidatus Malihini olakiniferum]